MSVKIDITDDQLRKAQDVLAHIPGGAEKALARAINRAIGTANAEATRQLQGQYVIKNKKVIVQAKSIKRRATSRNLFARIEAKGSPIPLGAFLTNPKKPPKRRLKRQLFARVKSSGGGTIKSAFITTVQTGHIGVRHAGVFIRTGERGRRGNPKLERIKQLYGPSIPQMLGNEEIQDFLVKRAKLVLDERLEHEMDVILRGVVK